MNFLHIQIDTYNTGHSLELKIKAYNNSVQSLPRFDYIEYPDVEYLMYLVQWLKSHSIYGKGTE